VTLILAEKVIPAKARLGEAEGSLGRNPGKYWIPGQARNDNPRRTSIVKYDFYLYLNPIFHHSIIPDFFFGGFE